MLASLRSEGTATLITTHDMQEAEELADRTGILAEGRLCAEGSLEELVRAHFGRAKELTVHVSRRLDEAEAGLLRAAGLESSGDGETWSGNAEHGIKDLAALARTLSEAGLPTEEMRIREPGLREVFFRATGREYAP
jgi:ABC-2 type transport system ATP-binding protein